MIETEHLLLRAYREKDLDESFAMNSDVRILKYLGNKPATREKSWMRLLRNVGHWSLKDFGVFAIFEKETGRFVGNTGLAHHERGLGEQFDPFPEAGWVLGPLVPRQGLCERGRTGGPSLVRRERQSPADGLHDRAGKFPVAAHGQRLGYQAFGHSEYRDEAVVLFARPRGA